MSSLLRANVVDTFSVTRNTAAGNTAFTAVIPPYTGAKGEARKLFLVDTAQTGPNGMTGKANWQTEVDCFIHITDFQQINNATTSHTCSILRPLNWTYFTAQIASNTTTVNGNIKEDPGVYSTNYRYPLPLQTGPGQSGNTSTVCQVADAAISSTNKYVMYQFADGTWQLDTIASGTFGGANLALTTGTPNRAGAIILKNSPLFYFGATTPLADPATGGTLQFDTTINTTQTLQSNLASLWTTLHRGDPLVFYNPNGTNADTLAYIQGVYTKDW